MQSDCNLVMHDANGRAIWSTGTHANSPILPCRLIMYTNGYLCVVNAIDQILWHS
jgi:hypothetical protein